MKDERIQTTANHFAAIGFFIWYILMSISLCCRTLILKQHPREWWDIFAIFCFGTIFVFVAYANKGILDCDFKRRWLTICISAIIGIFAAQFIAGQIHSVVDVAGTLSGALLGMGLVIGIAYFLNRRWKRNEGIEDE
jgi:VanZ family protein